METDILVGWIPYGYRGYKMDDENILQKMSTIKELQNRINRVCEFIEDNLIDQQNAIGGFLNSELRLVIKILKGESH